MFVFWKVVEKVIFTLESIETIKDKTLLKVISVISLCVSVGCLTTVYLLFGLLN